eukprot:sb/3475705/
MINPVLSSGNIVYDKAVISYDLLPYGGESIPNKQQQHVWKTIPIFQEPTETSKLITRYLGHVTGYLPIRDQYFLIRSNVFLSSLSFRYHKLFTSDICHHSSSFYLSSLVSGLSLPTIHYPTLSL